MGEKWSRSTRRIPIIAPEAPEGEERLALAGEQGSAPGLSDSSVMCFSLSLTTSLWCGCRRKGWSKQERKDHPSYRTEDRRQIPLRATLPVGLRIAERSLMRIFL